MKGAGGVCKSLVVIFILSLLIQGVCAAESIDTSSSETFNSTINCTVIGAINDTTNETFNGTIAGTINGTVNDTVSGTVIGTINGTITDPANGTAIGTINGALNGTISGTTYKIHPFQWVLIIPILVGYLIFLCWMCRFFDRMNFCFVVFILIMLIVLLLWLTPLNLSSTATWVIFVIVLLLLIIILLIILFPAVCCEVFAKRENNPGNGSNTTNKSNPIMNLHDITRNFIIISATLMWPLLLLYFYINDIESIMFYGIEKLEFPIYIIAASTIGALSYLLLSIEETFSQLLPEYKKIGIAWSYIRRILIAPFIALIVVYLLPFQNSTDVNSTNEKFLFLFPAYSKEELESRTETYNVENSVFVKKLGLDEDLACMLYNAKIRTIEELAGCNAKELANKVNLDTRNLGEGIWCLVKGQSDRLGSYSEKQIQRYINKAQEYMEIDKSDFVKEQELKMSKDQAFKLCYIASIKTIEELANCDPGKVHEILCDCPKEAEELAKREMKKYEDVHEALCNYSEKKIEKFKEDAKIIQNKKLEIEKPSNHHES
jgi:outer membrane lipoprotein SlyB